MALFNYSAKEITLKVVYYGPGFSGKTTNLQHLHSILPSTTRGKLISLTTEADRTLFFDFLPIDMGKIKDFNIRFQLYTVPGQVRYNATRRLVLKGADAVVFVADSQREMVDQNIESYNNMRENLTVNNIEPDEIPIVFQYNKRDVADVRSVSELNNDMNKDNAPFFEAVAVEGKGVKETFKEITDNLIKHIAKKHKVDIESPDEILPSSSEPARPEPLQPEPSRPESPLQQSSRSGVKTLWEQRPYVSPSRTRREERIVAPPAIDLSELVAALGKLTGVMTEIGSILKEMQKKQSKLSNELFELRKIFSEAREKKGLRKLFK
jgi:signal recognition particle receptor subunit beta